MAYENFDALLTNLHKGSGAKLEDQDLPQMILINEKREFIIPQDYNTIIAYEGDVNSQIITFDGPLYHEGHDLSKCDYKKIRWRNAVSGVEGNNTLTSTVSNDRQHLSWQVPAEAFTKSGQLQFSISIYDLDSTGRFVAFQWNTASCNALSVSSTMENVGSFHPAADEVLLVNEETRSIVAPRGYNGIIANYGDEGTARVFFRLNRFIRGIDVLDVGTIRTIRWKIDNKISSTTDGIFINPYTVELEDKIANKSGLIDLVWEVPREVTCNDQFYAGKFDIEVGFISADGTRIWRTSAFSGLSIGKSLFMMSPSPLPDSEGYYVIDGNKVNGTGVNTEVAGIYTLRSFETGQETTLKKNELAVEYDENGEYVGLRVGSNPAGENSTTAKYADKILQGETIILDGGNASGN